LDYFHFWWAEKPRHVSIAGILGGHEAPERLALYVAFRAARERRRWREERETEATDLVIRSRRRYRPPGSGKSVDAHGDESG